MAALSITKSSECPAEWSWTLDERKPSTAGLRGFGLFEVLYGFLEIFDIRWVFHFPSVFLFSSPLKVSGSRSHLSRRSAEAIQNLEALHFF